MLPLLRLRRRRQQPPREHHRLGARAVPRRTTTTRRSPSGTSSTTSTASCTIPATASKFADNLKRELPRIPFAPGLPGVRRRPARNWPSCTSTTNKLEPWPLKWVEAEGVPLSYRVEDKMRLSKDKTTLERQRVADAGRHPAGGLRLPPRQPQRPGMGHRPVPGQRGQAQRHPLRPEPRRRPGIHRPPRRPGRPRQRGNGADRGGLPEKYAP